MTSSLEPGAEQMRQMGYPAVDFIGGLETAPADGRGSSAPEPRRALPAAPGKEGTGFAEWLRQFASAAGRAGETADPSYAFLLQSPWSASTHFSLFIEQRWECTSKGHMIHILQRRPAFLAGFRKCYFSVSIDGALVAEAAGK